MCPSESVTLLLNEMSRGNASAQSRLWTLVYDEIRSIARNLLRREKSSPVLQTTALVHEAYLRLVDRTRIDWHGRAHFYRVAAQTVRRILIDWARSEKRVKRGGQNRCVPLDEKLIPGKTDLSLDELLDLDEALERLSSRNERIGAVVELHFFAGLTLDEIAKVLDVSKRTVAGDWSFARHWLHQALGDTTEDAAP